jgi:hypothetical protein
MEYKMSEAEQKAYKDMPQGFRRFFSYYLESFYYLQSRKIRQANQIALLNNLQRGDENIASTLLLTLFNRVMSNLYDDKMQVKFVPSEEMEQKKINTLNILAQNDYREMNMKALDYDWTWDTLFFGRGYMETLRFDHKRKIMQPHVINPLVFGYDPFFANPQEWRYYWKWVTKSRHEINALIKAGVIKGISKAEDLPSGVDAYLWNYKIIRDRAKYVTPNADDSYLGDVYQILEMFAYDDDGDKAVFWFDRDFAHLLYQEKLDLQDGEDIVTPDGKSIATGSKWPICVKEAFREPHSAVNFSVADLLEDKHRARSVLLNLAFIAAKDKANPLYVYDPDKVRDVTQLFSRQVSQHIPVTDVTTAIAPLNTDPAMDPTLQVFMQVLNVEASDPVGTNIQAAPQKKGKETATEAAIQQQLSDLAQSLQSKVLQLGVEEFWSHWYCRYRRYTKAGDEKLATIVGVKGMTFEKIDLGDIRTNFPPGVLVYSAKEAEYKELVERRDLMELLPVFQTSLTPDGMRNLLKYVFFPKFQSLDPQTIEVLLPDSLDEMKAEDENEILDKDQFVEVLPTDNHEQHLAVHAQSKNTWAKFIHMDWHEKMLSEQKMQMMQQQQMQMQAGQEMQPGVGTNVPEEPPEPQVGVAGQSPLGAAASLREKTLQDVGQKQMQM